MKGVIFDFDGTLYGDVKLWTQLIEETLAELGLNVSADAALRKARRMIDEGIFYNISGVAIALAKDNGVERPDAEVRQKFLDKLDLVMDTTGPGEGLIDLLQTLQASGIRMGIVTFQRFLRLEKRLERWKMRDYFDSIVTPDQVPEFKPSPLPFIRSISELELEASDCLVVGDEPVDVIGARKTGCRALGIPNGFFSGEELIKAGAEETIESLQDLKSILPTKSIGVRNRDIGSSKKTKS